MNSTALTSNKDILFVTGFPRSGTTWTNSIFLHCFKCGFANEIQFLMQFDRRLGNYGDLRKAANLDRLVTDLLADEYFRILKNTYRIEISKAELMERLERPNFASVVYAVLEAVSQHLRKDIVGGKCPSLGYDLEKLYSLFPNAKVVHVIRDGRDCALSHYRMSWGFRNAYMVARNWAKYVRNARTVGARVGPGQYLDFRYEDLLRDPAVVLGRLECFILGFEDAEVRACGLAEAANNGIADNFNKWKLKMSPKDQGIFEAVAGDLLAQLGYDPSEHRHHVSWLEAAYWTIEHRVRKEVRALMRRLSPAMGERRKVR